MNDYEKQKEHYDKAIEKLIEAEKEFQELTPENKEKYVDQVLRMYGMSEVLNMFKNRR